MAALRFILQPEEIEILEAAQNVVRNGLSWKEGDPLPLGLVSESAVLYILRAPQLFSLLVCVLKENAQACPSDS